MIPQEHSFPPYFGVFCYFFQAMIPPELPKRILNELLDSFPSHTITYSAMLQHGTFNLYPPQKSVSCKTSYVGMQNQEKFLGLLKKKISIWGVFFLCLVRKIEVKVRQLELGSETVFSVCNLSSRNLSLWTVDFILKVG